ncbi:MAG: hypothetical protein HW401_266, partial [Parcubacteria group bacterium]|nr:hypothetical protein [Parcubacteria group bacterium]
CAVYRESFGRRRGSDADSVVDGVNIESAGVKVGIAS